MKANLQQRLILSFVLIISISLIGSFIVISGIGIDLFFGYFDEPRLDNNLALVSQQHDQIKDFLIDRAETTITNYDLLNQYSTKSDIDRIGHIIFSNEKEIYHSPSLNGIERKNLLNEDMVDVFENDSELIVDQVLQSNIIFTDQTYKVYSFYLFRLQEHPYFFAYGAYNLSVFVIIITLSCLLLIGIFRHMRRNTQALTHMTEQIIKGDLQTKMVLNNEGEFTLLANAVDKVRENLHKAAEEKKTLEDEREKMFMNIAHDIKTPITSIKGYSQILANDYIINKNTTKEYLDIIINKSTVIEKMIDNLGDVIRYQGSHIELDQMNIPVKDFLEDCINEFYINTENNKFSIHLFVNPEIDTIYADPALLQRVFMNIIGNSIKYNPNTPLDIHIYCQPHGEYIQFNLVDNGIGVPNEALDKLFERLYRVDTSRNNNIEGSGIGLTICKEIIEAHGGSIYAYKTNNTFTVEINLLREEIIT